MTWKVRAVMASSTHFPKKTEARESGAILLGGDEYSTARKVERMPLPQATDLFLSTEPGTADSLAALTAILQLMGRGE